ncbi:uncharacterized protein LOC109792962 [Cajanus cajan]|uniref:Uncharacterized protein n=1 Tax=Cajanus cajan TaxID=3821 RepID=A0A151QRT0_CAJCA|nr:uncharacterized protein LOC109792962 [Cajanus cajan]KYP32964.1 hypothetical protein KK1_046238 [Cajanus cajan]
MGVISFAVGGVGLIAVGGHEALVHGRAGAKKTPSPLFWISLVIFSSLLLLNSTVSLLDAHNSNDAVGTALQLQVLPVALLFLFYSLLPLLLPLPSPLLSLVASFAFALEFLLFYLQRKDPTGVENRYYDLFLLPIALCLFCTLLHVRSPFSHFPRLGLGLGLILQGTWLLQMGLSLFSGFVAHGCSLHRPSRGNYTLRCQGHPEFHRARAIATLQFNCHLALLLLLFVAFFSATNSGSIPTSYAPLGAELQHIHNSPNFTLDSDDDTPSPKEKVLVLNGNAD